MRYECSPAYHIYVILQMDAVASHPLLTSDTSMAGWQARPQYVRENQRVRQAFSEKANAETSSIIGQTGFSFTVKFFWHSTI